MMCRDEREALDRLGAGAWAVDMGNNGGRLGSAGVSSEGRRTDCPADHGEGACSGPAYRKFRKLLFSRQRA